MEEKEEHISLELGGGGGGGSVNGSVSYHDPIPAIAFALVTLALILFSSAFVLFGQPSLLENDSKDDWIARGLRQTMHQAQMVFLMLPVQTVFIGVIWLIVLGRNPKLYAPFSLAAGVTLASGGCVFILAHASKHENALLHFIGLMGLMLCAVFAYQAWGRWTQLDLTAALMDEGLIPFRNGGFLCVGFGLLALYLMFYLLLTVTAISLFSYPDASATDKIDTSVRWMIMFLFAGGFWVQSFLRAVLRVTVSAAVGEWYFARDASLDVNERPLTAFAKASTYMFGTCALGGLCLGPMSLIRTCRKHMDKQEGGATTSWLCSLHVCQTLAPMINDFALVYAGMHMQPLMVSAREVCKLFSRHACSAVLKAEFDVSVATSGHMIAVGAGLLLLGYSVKDEGQELHLATIFVTAMLSSAIFEVFSALALVSADTVIVCYCEDVDRDGQNVLATPSLVALIKERVQANQAAVDAHGDARVQSQTGDNL